MNNTDKTLIPLSDKIVVKRSDNTEQMTPGGIIIPDNAKEKPQEGKVIAIGNGRLLKNGKRQPVDIAVNDTVLFTRYGGSEITHNDTEYLILPEDNILAKVTEGSPDA